jgi:ATP-binding cassette subfamily B protein
MARINEVLNTEPSIKSPEFPETPSTAQGIFSGPADASVPVIELRNLSFGYSEESAPVLDAISLSIQQGMVLGILGRTGSGKSTLLKTLVRMVDPPAGTVFIQGLDVRRWALPELRRTFGVSPQDSYLFSDTIKNNIAYGANISSGTGAGPQQDEATGESLETLTGAALISALDKDLENFSQGWETLIGERGLTLSGGQKQRVAIARAVLSSPEILMLDDAFSAVDAETEKRILGNILEDRSRGQKTTIIVSHRVSTLSCAAKVAVLENGRISEYGTPEELISEGNFFARMAELQQLGEIDSAEGSGG